MKTLFIEKTTIDWDKKTRCKADAPKAQKVRNLKRLRRYGYAPKEVISKYGIKQYVALSCNYDELTA
ncbi:MAG: hypothetical protein IIX89_03615 [Oscillospiraceae bacterium]|nr:hypothetical protein [Oscillospiraceae bacterium]MBQ5816498.1 hypothetical protein [Oscillospiraceae bacterium]